MHRKSPGTRWSPSQLWNPTGSRYEDSHPGGGKHSLLSPWFFHVEVISQSSFLHGSWLSSLICTGLCWPHWKWALEILPYWETALSTFILSIDYLPYMAKGTLHMWLRILGCRDYPGLSGWVLSVIITVLYIEKKVNVGEGDDVMTEADWIHGSRTQGMPVTSNLEKARNGFYPGASRKNQFSWHLDFSPLTLIWFCHLQNYKMTNWYCFKPLNLC